MDHEPFGLRLSRGRRAAGLSQEELSDKTGVPLRTLQEYEQNRCRPNADRAWLLLSAVGLVAGEEVPA